MLLKLVMLFTRSLSCPRSTSLMRVNRETNDLDRKCDSSYLSPRRTNPRMPLLRGLQRARHTRMSCRNTPFRSGSGEGCRRVEGENTKLPELPPLTFAFLNDQDEPQYTIQCLPIVLDMLPDRTLYVHTDIMSFRADRDRQLCSLFAVQASEAAELRNRRPIKIRVLLDSQR